MAHYAIMRLAKVKTMGHIHSLLRRWARGRSRQTYRARPGDTTERRRGADAAQRAAGRDRRLARRRPGPACRWRRSIRKNAVLSIEMMLGASPEWFTAGTRGRAGPPPGRVARSLDGVAARDVRRAERGRGSAPPRRIDPAHSGAHRPHRRAREAERPALHRRGPPSPGRTAGQLRGEDGGAGPGARGPGSVATHQEVKRWYAQREGGLARGGAGGRCRRRDRACPERSWPGLGVRPAAA